MNKKFTAKITWIKPNDGGRTVLPQGDKYAPIIIKHNEEFSDQNEFWSLFVNNKTVIDEFTTIAEVYYLSEKAPLNLFSGFQFDLYEGPKKVAEGKIL